MRLEITRRSDLATRALIELDRLARRTKSGELADAIGTTPGFLSQTMTPLAAKGWVRSEPGPSGGYLLTDDLEDVSILDVIEAIEGPSDSGRCVLEDRPCASGGPCALHQPWQRARTQLLDELSNSTLAALPEARP
jgi:Rrf2 family iron-sulfur cluster assembly transcriptional regulator